jgi:hypothetical protein
LGGGEPFLNPHAPEMLAYAVSKLGRERVSVTTNFSLLPNSLTEMVSFLNRCGNPTFNLSIDSQHLLGHQKIKSDVVKKISLFFSAAKKTNTFVVVGRVALNVKEQMSPLPREVSQTIPGLTPTEMRLDMLSKTGALSSLAAVNLIGREKTYVGDNHKIFERTGIAPDYASFVSIIFRVDGRAYISTDLSMPSSFFSIGSWKREPMQKIFGSNLSASVARLRKLLYGETRKADVFRQTALRKIINKEIGYRVSAERKRLGTKGRISLKVLQPKRK